QVGRSSVGWQGKSNRLCLPYPVPAFPGRGPIDGGGSVLLVGVPQCVFPPLRAEHPSGEAFPQSRRWFPCRSHLVSLLRSNILLADTSLLYREPNRPLDLSPSAPANHASTLIPFTPPCIPS